MKMLEWTVSREYHQRKLIRSICGQFAWLRPALMYRALRRRDVQINGNRIHQDQMVHAGDQIRIYGISPDAATVPATGPQPEIIESGEHLLIVRKPAGISVHRDPSMRPDEQSLIERLKDETGDSRLRLCHRLDRQTEGLLIVARTPEIETAVRELMEHNLIIKRYRALVQGVPSAGQPVTAHDGLYFRECRAWLEKQTRQKLVFIHETPRINDQPIITRYRMISRYPSPKEALKGGTGGKSSEWVSDLEIELPTGRTHQIRAHLASLGHPLLGDGKYGRNEYNRHFSGKHGLLRRQQLTAVYLHFSEKIKGPLAAMAGRTFQIEPDFDWPKN